MMSETLLDQALYLLIVVLKILAVVVPLILAVAYYTYAERKVIGYMQIRRGPNRIGPLGLFQPFADVFKLLLKEIILPENANKFLFLLAPVLSLAEVRHHPHHRARVTYLEDGETWQPAPAPCAAAHWPSQPCQSARSPKRSRSQPGLHLAAATSGL